jgi:chemotaxis protein MotB
MARRKKHEEHQNHEAWAIPYGDLITLLLAFFVVMYAISSVNEGKYRVLSDSLVAAFRGVGERSASSLAAPVVQIESDLDPRLLALRRMAEQLEAAMQPLIAQGMLDVHRGDGFVEVAIRSDILFASGVAQLTETARR